MKLIVALLSGALLVPTAGAAQLRRQAPPEKLLVLPPTVAEPTDSSFSVELTTLVRERIASKSRYLIGVIPTPAINEALVASGFPPNAILDLSNSHQLARFFGANAMAVGEVQRNGGGRRVEYRVLDVSRSGASGSVVIDAAADRELKKIADEVADSIDVILRSAEEVRACEEERGRGRFDNAIKRARDALETYAQNGSAYLCMATVYEAKRMDDSVRYALERTVEVDSLNGAAWDRLGRLRQQAGDTLGAAHAFHARLRVRPLDQQLRIGVALLYAQVGNVDSAVSVLDGGLDPNSPDLAILEYKERLCTEAGRWDCILETLAQVEQIDTTLVDTAFFAKAIGAAQQSDDTVAQVAWAGKATRRYTDRAEYWKALGDGYQKLGKSDSAVTAFQQALRLDSTDVNAALAVANARIDAQQTDSVTWGMLDMAAMSGTEAEQRLAALMLVKFGSQKLQAQDWEGAKDALERALAVDSGTPPRSSAALQLGIAYFQLLNGSYTRAQQTKQFSCEQAAEWEAWHTRGQAYLEEGQRVNQPFADQYLGYYRQYGGLIPQVKEILKCR